MRTVWDDVFAGHALPELLREFHCYVAILEKESIRLFGEGELTFRHRSEKQNCQARNAATVGGGIGVMRQRAQETVEMPMFVKNGQSDEQPYDAFERR